MLTRLYATEETKTNDVDESEKLAEMMKLIVNAVQEGREDDLVKAGLKVTMKSARETLDDKIADPQVNQNIFGMMTSEDEEVMQQLSAQIAADLEERASDGSGSRVSGNIRSGGGSSSSDIDLDPLVFAELQAEVRETLYSLRSKGSGMAALLDDANSSDDGFDATQRGRHSEFGDLNGVLDNIMSARSPLLPATTTTTTTTKKKDNEWSPTAGVEQELGQTSWSAVGPPAVAPGSRLEVEEAADEEEEEQRPSTLSNELPITPKPAYEATEDPPIPTVDGTADKSLLRDIVDVNADLKQIGEAATTTAPAAGKTDTADAQETFAMLLKATMEQQTDAATALLTDLPDDMVRGTVDAITQGDIAALDMKTLLGEALSTLTEQLGIDMKSELQNNPQTMGDIQNLMAVNMADLAKNMEELDKESAVLFDQLGSLEADLRKETAAFDEQKQLELGELLQSQNQLQEEFTRSSAKVQVSTAQLEKMMKTLEEDADVMTALALFPIKTVDKKIAFIVGLALVFKVPFDLSRLVAFGSTDFTDMLTILTQTGLCLACLNHYGLLGAFFKKSNNFALPPPPENL